MHGQSQDLRAPIANSDAGPSIGGPSPVSSSALHASLQQAGARYALRRAERHHDMMARMARCRDPAQLIELQFFYGAEVISDTAGLGWRIAALLQRPTLGRFG